MQKDEEVEYFREKFAGSQADRLLKAEAESKKIAEQVKNVAISGSLCVHLLLISGHSFSLLINFRNYNHKMFYMSVNCDWVVSNL